ncbi:NADPH-dependent FMN reductase [Guggenheimella bovis]
MKLGIVVGSIRKGSYNRRLGEKVQSFLPDDIEVEFLEIKDLPFYDEAYDEGETPEIYQAFRNKLKACDAFLFITPEYNRSFSGVLKNALEVGSRPYGLSKWKGKRAGVIGSSVGPYGAIVGVTELRRVVSHMMMDTIEQPELCVPFVDKALETGSSDEFIKIFTDAFVAHLKK